MRMDNDKGRRIILVGQNGSGKSTIGNSLLGKYAFSHRNITQCRHSNCINKIHDISLDIINTPGLFDDGVPLAMGALEIHKSIDLCPNPHVFLIVVTPNNDLGKNEHIAMTVDMLRLIFGENIFDNAIVVLTYNDESEVDFWLVENLLVSLCGERVVKSKNVDEGMNQRTVTAIFNTIKTMSCNGVATYSQRSLGTHRKILQEYTSVDSGEFSVKQIISELNQRLEKEKTRDSKVQNMVKIILIGKSGNGKSSTGNTLLGYDGFIVKKSLDAATEKCEMKTGFLNGKEIKVVDTPGLFDAGSSLAERALEIQKSVSICPKPNAFLLVYSSANRLTEEEVFTIDLLRIVFGDKVFEHVTIVFTRGGEFKDEGKFKQFWKENEYLKDLVNRCNGRICKIENSNERRAEDVADFITTIEKCSMYQYMHINAHKEALEEHLKNFTSESGDIKKHIEDLDERLSKKLDCGIWKTGLVFAGVAILTYASGPLAPILGVEASTVQTTVVGGTLLVNTWTCIKRMWSRRK